MLDYLNEKFYTHHQPLELEFRTAVRRIRIHYWTEKQIPPQPLDTPKEALHAHRCEAPFGCNSISTHNVWSDQRAAKSSPEVSTHANMYYQPSVRLIIFGYRPQLPLRRQLQPLAFTRASMDQSLFARG